VVAATIQEKDEIIKTKTCHMKLILFIFKKLILMCMLLDTL